MLPRRIAATLTRRLRRYPAVALVGPRQSGKTTLARSIPGRYFDLEQEPERLRLDLDWDELVAGKGLVILDEAQTWPDVFPRLRGAIDAGRRRMGRFLLLGSISPSLMVRVSESLAGRLSVVELTPFLWNELSAARRARLWLCGGYPDGGVLDADQFPQWQHDYLALLTQRDLPSWGLPARPQVTQRLLRLVAAVHGQLWNASQVGQGLGLSYQTVNSYMDYLEGAFLVRRLPAWHVNLRKRVLRSPKVYWRDTGLLHSLLDASDRDELLHRPWVGASWEGFVIEQILGVLGQRDVAFEAFHLRTSDQYEIDLLLKLGRELWAIEIKLTASPGVADLQRLTKTAELVRARRRFLISQTRRNVDGGDAVSCNLGWFLDHVAGSL